jgi:hypothetical protein
MGNAEVNGVIEDYRITVQDNGEPNRGIDNFTIDTTSYDAGGPVTYGNVQGIGRRRAAVTASSRLPSSAYGPERSYRRR